jgi:acetyltransferase-like isoleucine patch superfamily enzyme
VGARVILLPGVTVGRHAVVGAGSVVTKDVPDYAVAAGNPARIIRFRDNAPESRQRCE